MTLTGLQSVTLILIRVKSMYATTPFLFILGLNQLLIKYQLKYYKLYDIYIYTTLENQV